MTGEFETPDETAVCRIRTPQLCLNLVKQSWGWGANPSSFSPLFREKKRALCTPEKSGIGRATSQNLHLRFQVLGKGDTSGFGGWEEQVMPDMGQDSSLGPQQAQRHLAMEQGQDWSCGTNIPLLLPIALHPKGDLATPAHSPDRGRREGSSPVKLQGN